MSIIIFSHFINREIIERVIYLKEHLVNPDSQGPEPVLLTITL